MTEWEDITGNVNELEVAASLFDPREVALLASCVIEAALISQGYALVGRDRVANEQNALARAELFVKWLEESGG